MVTWGGNNLFSVADVEARADRLAEFARVLRPGVVPLREVTTPEIAAVARPFGMPDGPEHVAAGDSNPIDDDRWNNLEVAILSREPLSNVVEYGRGTDGNSQPASPPEITIDRRPLGGVAELGVGRGFPVADVPAPNLLATTTHLKSSRGDSGARDRENAREWEPIAAGIARFVADRIAGDPEATVVVGGDFNVGETDAGKWGVVPRFPPTCEAAPVLLVRAAAAGGAGDGVRPETTNAPGRGPNRFGLGSPRGLAAGSGGNAPGPGTAAGSIPVWVGGTCVGGRTRTGRV